jgi:hypothetical protein
MGVTSEGLSYAETQMKNYRHRASLGSPYHVAAVRGWSDAESKAVIAEARRGKETER